MSELVIRVQPESHVVLKTMAETAESDLGWFTRESLDLGFACADIMLANQLQGVPTYAYCEDHPEEFREVPIDFMPAVQNDEEAAVSTYDPSIPIDPFDSEEHLDINFDEETETELRQYTALLSTTPEAFLIECFNLRWELELVMKAGRRMFVNDAVGNDYIEVGRVE